MAEVERRLSVIEEQEAVVAASLQRAARLRQSILERAFSGQTPLLTLEDITQVDDGLVCPNAIHHSPEII